MLTNLRIFILGLLSGSISDAPSEVTLETVLQALCNADAAVDKAADRRLVQIARKLLNEQDSLDFRR